MLLLMTKKRIAVHPLNSATANKWRLISIIGKLYNYTLLALAFIIHQGEEEDGRGEKSHNMFSVPASSVIWVSFGQDKRRITTIMTI